VIGGGSGELLGHSIIAQISCFFSRQIATMQTK
jgi:hypothetical protein